MGLFDFFKQHKSNDSKQFKDSPEAKRLLAQIEKHNKDLEIIKEEYFDGIGKPYSYFYKDNKLKAEGFYYYLGYDKRGEIVDEKFQGKNVEYYENGQIKEIVYYKDGFETDEASYFDKDGNLR